MEPKPLSNRLDAVIPYAVTALGLIVFGTTVIGSLQYFGKVNDLPQYVSAARLVVEGRAAEVYILPALFAQEKANFPDLVRGIGLFVPPVAVPFLLPLAFLPLSVASVAWTVFLTAALFLAIYLMSRIFNLDTKAKWWLCGLTMLCGPAGEAVRIGQLAPIMLVALCSFAALANRVPILAALSLMLLIFKPQQMVPLVVYLIAAGKYRMTLTFMLMGGALMIISFLIFGQSGFENYIHIVRDPANLMLMQPDLTPTFRGQVLRILGPQSPVSGNLAVLAILAAYGLIFIIGRGQKGRADWLNAGLIAALPLGAVTSLHCHDYDLLLLIPGIVLAFRDDVWARVSMPLRWVAWVAVVLFLQPFYNDIHYTYLLKDHGVINPHFLGLLVYSLIAALAVMKMSTKADEDVPAEAPPAVDQ